MRTPEDKRGDPNAVSALLKLMALEGTLPRQSRRWGDPSAPGDWTCPSIVAASTTCLALPALPVVMALQGWGADLSSPHLNMCPLLLADLTEPVSSQVAPSLLHATCIPTCSPQVPPVRSTYVQSPAGSSACVCPS